MLITDIANPASRTAGLQLSSLPAVIEENRPSSEHFRVFLFVGFLFSTSPDNPDIAEAEANAGSGRYSGNYKAE